MRAKTAAVDPFHAVSDPTRRGILDLLAEGERSVNELVAAFTISQPSISRHLRVLRDAGVVTQHRRGRQRVYHLRPEPLRLVYDWIGHYERFWDDRLAALGELLRADQPGQAPRPGRSPLGHGRDGGGRGRAPDGSQESR